MKRLFEPEHDAGTPDAHLARVLHRAFAPVIQAIEDERMVAHPLWGMVRRSLIQINKAIERLYGDAN